MPIRCQFLDGAMPLMELRLPPCFDAQIKKRLKFTIALCAGCAIGRCRAICVCGNGHDQSGRPLEKCSLGAFCVTYPFRALHASPYPLVLPRRLQDRSSTGCEQCFTCTHSPSRARRMVNRCFIVVPPLGPSVCAD